MNWETITEKAKEIKIWSSLTVLDEDGTLLMNTAPIGEEKMGHVKPMLDALYKSRDDAVQRGIDWDGVHYDVYQWSETGLLFGRVPDRVDCDGCSILKHKGLFYVLIYKYPITTPLAVHTLEDFISDNIDKGL